MSTQQIKKYCELGEQTKKILAAAINQYKLSARAFYRIIKVARTIADLASEQEIKPEHLSEALMYRPKEREVF